MTFKDAFNRAYTVRECLSDYLEGPRSLREAERVIGEAIMGLSGLLQMLHKQTKETTVIERDPAWIPATSDVEPVEAGESFLPVQFGPIGRAEITGETGMRIPPDAHHVRLVRQSDGLYGLLFVMD